jgi:flagellar motor switch protein FliG
MGEKTIVLTMYGREKTVESISISLIDNSDRYSSESKRAAGMLQERMEGLHDISKDEVKLAQNKIVDFVHKLYSNGYLVFAE